ncbi:MAG TPA: NADH-quinone oxidoreductase subunit C [Thermoplasmata archaeon]|nr:NADH-quinone oxidoreductase subunit C [Thermoplasmata archaeon]
MADGLTTEQLAGRLKERFPAGITAVEPFGGTLGRVRFDASLVLELLREMRDVHTFTHLAMVAAIDWEKEREVLYTLWSDERRAYVHLSTMVPAASPHLESATPVFPSADWHEREAWELVDVTFDHHPDLRNLLLPTGYKFHPLLRSFKLHEPEELEVKVRDV